MKILINLPKIAVVYIIKFYRFFISPLFPDVCRYYPSCSTYAVEAFEKYGLLKGFIKSIKRLLKCNALYPGGYDPLK